MSSDARLAGLSGAPIADEGRMAEGRDADLTIVDLNARHELRHADMKSGVGWTPFDGMQAQGRAVATVVRGRVAMRDREVQGSAAGESVRFMETLAG